MRARILTLLLLLAALVFLGPRGAALVPGFTAWVQGQGIAGVLVFVAGYVVATVAFVPGSLLTLAAGALFGLVRGTAAVLVGATLGASAAFLVARYVARGAVERRLAGSPRFAAVDRAVGREGLKIVLLLRLSPIVPFNVLNYALGLTRVRYVDFLLASVGMVPGTLLYVYYGKVAGDVARLAGGGRVEKDWTYYALLGLGLVATVLATSVVARAARRALEGTTDGEPDPA